MAGITHLTTADDTMDSNMPPTEPQSPPRPQKRPLIHEHSRKADTPTTLPYSIHRRSAVNSLDSTTAPSYPRRAIQSSRYEPYPFLSQGEAYSPDMWSGRRFSIADKSKEWYKRKGLEPLSAYENFTEADAEWTYPTPDCQRIGCSQETTHEHTEAELQSNLEEPATASSIIRIEDEEDRARAFSLAFDDDEDYQRAIHAAPVRTRPPPRIRNIQNSSSLLVGWKDGTKDLRRALPKPSEVIDLTGPSPPHTPRPPGSLSELPIRPVDGRKAFFVKPDQSDVRQPSDINGSPVMTLATSKLAGHSHKGALRNVSNIPIRSRPRAPMTDAIKERRKRALEGTIYPTAVEIEKSLMEEDVRRI